MVDHPGRSARLPGYERWRLTEAPFAETLDDKKEAERSVTQLWPAIPFYWTCCMHCFASS
jgi:hypothetical protein